MRPIAPPAVAIAPKMPNAFARSFGSVNDVMSSASAEGTRMAANTPWHARAATSVAKLVDAPPTAETPAKPTRPTRNVVLRPIRSPSFPPAKRRLPNARLYAVTPHCRSAVVKFRARCADGNAMFITVRSSTTMSCAIPITPRASQRRRAAAGSGIALALTSIPVIEKGWCSRGRAIASGKSLVRRRLGHPACQLRPRSDSQFAECLVQVVLDGAWADEQLGGDLSVGVSLRDEAGDLLLLRRQLTECLDGAGTRMLAGRQQLDPRALGERLHAEGGEHAVGDTKL